MEIKYFADVRDLTGHNSVTWNVPASTLDELLHALAGRYGYRFAARMFEGLALSPTIIILVNGRDVRHLDGLETPLHADDTISIFPMVAGGQPLQAACQ
jgi:molybdopterin synthase sulfur carrier subunit